MVCFGLSMVRYGPFPREVEMEAQTLSPPTPPAVTPDWHRIFETLPDEHDYAVDEVEGAVPRELQGTLYRNGPSRNEIGGKPYAHLFDGDGMLSQFKLSGGRI